MNSEQLEELVWNDLEGTASDEDTDALHADLSAWKEAVILLKMREQGRVSEYREELGQLGASQNAGRIQNKRYWVLVRNLKNRQNEAIANSQELESKLAEVKKKISDEEASTPRKDPRANTSSFLEIVLKDIKEESVSQPNLARLYRQLVGAAATVKALVKDPPMRQWEGACHRCNQKSSDHVMSMFNKDLICMGCSDKESKHPDHKAAADAELAAVQSGNYNFSGVGKPRDL